MFGRDERPSRRIPVRRHRRDVVVAREVGERGLLGPIGERCRCEFPGHRIERGSIRASGSVVPRPRAPGSASPPRSCRSGLGIVAAILAKPGGDPRQQRPLLGIPGQHPAQPVPVPLGEHRPRTAHDPDQEPTEHQIVGDAVCGRARAGPGQPLREQHPETPDHGGRVLRSPGFPVDGRLCERAHEPGDPDRPSGRSSTSCRSGPGWTDRPQPAARGSRRTGRRSDPPPATERDRTLRSPHPSRRRRSPRTPRPFVRRPRSTPRRPRTPSTRRPIMGPPIPPPLERAVLDPLRTEHDGHGDGVLAANGVPRGPDSVRPPSTGSEDLQPFGHGAPSPWYAFGASRDHSC